MWSAATHEELYRLKAHEKQVYGVAFSPDSQTIYSISTDGRLVRWPIAIPSLPELLEWIKSNRYERPLSCEERQQYRVAPLCE